MDEHEPPLTDKQRAVIKQAMDAMGHVPIVSFDGKYTCHGCGVDDPTANRPHGKGCWVEPLKRATNDLAMLYMDLDPQNYS